MSEGTGSALDRRALLADLQKQVRYLEDDLLERSQEPPFAGQLDAEYHSAYDAKRTAWTYETWRDDRVTSAAVAWVLATVFIRFCEDNLLLPQPFLAGPGERLLQAEERQESHFRAVPEHGQRDWIEQAVSAMSVSRVAAGLFDHRHNPMWQLTPSQDAAKALLAFWRTQGADGEIVYCFTEDTWDTRFLGDLYQDLSKAARDNYALLQTPVFVEEFILARTLTPALDEFGLDPDGEPLRIIDPTCGSGHFLLGAFTHILAARRAAMPGDNDWALIRRTLKSVHGVDKNPAAVAIARFRLLLAAMREGNWTSLADDPDLPINIAVGDSLLHGVHGRQMEMVDVQGSLLAEEDVANYHYASEDVQDFPHILESGRYHVVVGNPPYIQVKDKQENQNYRERYKESCSGKYSLAAPFAQRFFQLAVKGGEAGRRAGFVGQITANSFMKREFGKKLIETFFPTVKLTHVIDTSGAHIPDHGTPTIILIGRREWPRGETVRAVLGIRGEPSQPEEPSRGFVWRAIVEQVDKPGSESEWVSAADLPRDQLASHPWSLSGGGAGPLLEALESGAQKLVTCAASIGIASVTGEDELFLLPANGSARRLHIKETRPLVDGGAVRDYSISAKLDSIWVYDEDWNVLDLSDLGGTEQLLDSYRSTISHRKRFGTPMVERGLAWYEWQELYTNKMHQPLTIAFAEVATHNHFVLDRGGKVFNRTAPVIKLSAGASEDDHLALLGVLNSSTACFWLKQVSHDKGHGGIGGGIASEDWERFYQFNSTKIGQFPLLANRPLSLARELDVLAQRLVATEPTAVCSAGVPTRARLDPARADWNRIRGRMIALQEELDWAVYQSYRLLDETTACAARWVGDTAELPTVQLGERAFEIVLARKMAAGEAQSQWFTRHGSKPITEIPTHWPDAYREVVAKRIEVIESNRDLALIERPECKRRWATESLEKREQAALRDWLLARCEAKELWFAEQDGVVQPRPLTVNRLADILRADADVVSVAALYAEGEGKRDADLANVLAGVLATEHVPYLASLRYKDTGLRKRVQWKNVWDLQRQEDATGERLNIAVPPKYGQGDFAQASYWRNRGKLDVPKERFVSYPYASPDGDASLLLGWAGWDHAQQAQALALLLLQREESESWPAERLVPLVAGLAEVLPWVQQWRTESVPEYGDSYANIYTSFLDDLKRRHELTDETLTAWRPLAKARGTRAKQ